MHALVFTGPGVVENLDVAEPEPADGEVLVEVTGAGICGSELHGIRAPGFRQPPLVMGHELAGTTADGRNVVVNPIISCGTCDLCAAGRPQICRTRAIVGIHRGGGFAERIAVPEGQLHEVPASLSPLQGATVEPLANGLHTWQLAGAPAGARVGVIGCGAIGICCLLAAKAGGAGEVTVTDLADERRDVARQLGADDVGTALDGEYDVIVDAVGAAATHRASVAHLRPGGTAVWIGLLGADAGFDATELVRQEKRVLGTFAYSDDVFAGAAAMITSVDLGWVQAFPLSAGARIFTELMHGRTDVVKAVLCP